MKVASLQRQARQELGVLDIEGKRDAVEAVVVAVAAVADVQSAAIGDHGLGQEGGVAAEGRGAEDDALACPFAGEIVEDAKAEPLSQLQLIAIKLVVDAGCGIEGEREVGRNLAGVDGECAKT